MASRLPLAVGIVFALLFQAASAQTPAQIRKTSTPPVIDGNGSDAAWASAEAHGTAEFFAGGVAVEPSADLTLEWRALWDDTNLYVMAKINDDAIVNSLPATGGPETTGVADWNDDGIEFYIDAQDVNNLEYNPASVGTAEPTYQFTALAGWTPTIANDATYLYPPEHPTNGGQPVSPRPLRDPPSLPNTSFTWGINSYDGNQVDRRYPQTMGSATSGPVTANPAGGFDWTFEASFPWTALEETPADILAAPRNGIFGFGVAYNDDDDREGRDSQPIWATTRDDLWHVSEAFPDARLVDAPSVSGDFNNNGSVDASDYVLWRDGGPLQNDPTPGVQPADYDFWKSRFGAISGAGAGLGAGSVPEPATLVLLLLLTTAWVLRRLRG